MTAAGEPDELVWHDLECGAYDADLPLWLELAAAHDGPVLDVGAGAGRVALALAAAGHRVTAVDLDARLCAALRERTAGQDPAVAVLERDARDLGAPGESFGLCLAPMQTVQLLGGERGRAAFLRGARSWLAPGGVLAAALADPLDGIDAQHTEPPPPDVRRAGGWVYVSQPVAVRVEPDAIAIERVRTATGPGFAQTTGDVVRLDRVTAATFEDEARRRGFDVLPRRRVAPTEEHVGSDVVMLARA